MAMDLTGPFGIVSGYQRGSGFKFVRDDGFIYYPGAEDNIQILFRMEDNTVLFSGKSTNLTFSEAVAGLISSFSFRDGVYFIRFDSEVLEAAFGVSASSVKFYLETSGDITLPNKYPRFYVEGCQPAELIRNRYRVVYLPYWKAIHDVTYPTPKRTERVDRIISSVPVKTLYTIRSAYPLADFNYPYQAIKWTSDEANTRWIWGQFLNDYRICWNGNAPHPTSPVGHVAIFYLHPWSDPWHHDHSWRDDQPVYDYSEYINLNEDPDGSTRNPTIQKPPYVSGAGGDYTYGNYMHHNVTMRLSISSCSWGDFGDMSLTMTSDFGYNMDIFHPTGGWDTRLSIPETELDTLPIIDGQFIDKSYNSAINLNWDVDGFSYMSVLHAEIHYNVWASLMKTRFDFSKMTFTPLPE
jgi:hypothetical protein